MTQAAARSMVLAWAFTNTVSQPCRAEEKGENDGERDRKVV